MSLLKLCFFTFPVFAIPLFERIEAIPLGDLADTEHYRHLEFRSSIYRSLPETERSRMIQTKPIRGRLRYLVPFELFEKYQNNKIQFKSLNHPRYLAEIDYRHKQRLRGGCPAPDQMFRGYKFNALNEFYLSCLEKQFPQWVKVFSIGKTRRGRRIMAARVRVSRNASEKPGLNFDPPEVAPRTPMHPRDTILINCSIHGNEPIAIDHCYDVLTHVVRKPQDYPALNDIDLWIVPIVNPDGVHNFWYRSLKSGRKNGYYSGRAGRRNFEGVDLNRNFPFMWKSDLDKASSGHPGHYFYRGPKAASEPETRAMMALAARENFLFSYSYHCYANSLLVPYSIEGLNNPEPHIAGELAEKLIEGINSHREDKPFLIKKNLYSVDGTDQDYYYHKHGTLAYLPESSHRFQDYRDVPKILEGLRPLWQNLLHAYATTRKIRLWILDADTGRPLQAQVDLDDRHFAEGEVHTSSSIGVFSRVVLNSKPVRVTVQKKGYKRQQITIRPNFNKLRTVISLEKL